MPELPGFITKPEQAEFPQLLLITMTTLFDLIEQQAETVCGGKKAMNVVGLQQDNSALNLGLGFGLLPNLIANGQFNLASVGVANL